MNIASVLIALTAVGVGAVAAGAADERMPDKSVAVPGTSAVLQPGLIGGGVALGLGLATKSPLLVGAAFGAFGVEAVQYAHHYAPQLFGKSPAQMTDGGAAVAGMAAPPREVAASVTYSDQDARSFWSAVDEVKRAT